MSLVYSTKDGYRAETPEELAQREADILATEEQALLDQLLPTPAEIEQAELELKAIILLMEVGLI